MQSPEAEVQLESLRGKARGSMGLGQSESCIHLDYSGVSGGAAGGPYRALHVHIKNFDFYSE